MKNLLYAVLAMSPIVAVSIFIIWVSLRNIIGVVDGICKIGMSCIALGLGITLVWMAYDYFKSFEK